jgi:hypothetical protein
MAAPIAGNSQAMTRSMVFDAMNVPLVGRGG